MTSLRENIDTEKVTMDNFKEALDKLKPSLSQSDINKYKKMEEEYLSKARAIVTEKPHYLG